MREAGLELEGRVGDPDPIVAVMDVWDPMKFDEIIVSTLPTGSSRWMGIDLPHRLEKLTSVPVRHVVSKPRQAEAPTGPPPEQPQKMGVLGALGAMMTDQIWYFAGWFDTRWLLRLYCRWTFSSEACVSRTTDYFRRYGALTIIIGRYVAGVRALAWPLARKSGVGYARFLLYDTVGAVVWTATWVLIGWLVGDRWESVVTSVGGWMVAILIAAAAILAAVIMFRRRARHGAAALG
jgi:membrane protein DedA with SNARE-associated domain